MAKIFECLPNISEARNTEVVEAVVNEVRGVPGVMLLDNSSDSSHNRTVIPSFRAPEAVAEPAGRLA